jgi:hypothetical protein
MDRMEIEKKLQRMREDRKRADATEDRRRVLNIEIDETALARVLGQNEERLAKGSTRSMKRVVDRAKRDVRKIVRRRFKQYDGPNASLTGAAKFENSWRGVYYPDRRNVLSLSPRGFIFFNAPWSSIFETGGTIEGDALVMPLPNAPKLGLGQSRSIAGRWQKRSNLAEARALLGNRDTGKRQSIPTANGYILGAGEEDVRRAGLVGKIKPTIFDAVNRRAFYALFWVTKRTRIKPRINVAAEVKKASALFPQIFPAEMKKIERSAARAAERKRLRETQPVSRGRWPGALAPSSSWYFGCVTRAPARARRHCRHGRPHSSTDLTRRR